VITSEGKRWQLRKQEGSKAFLEESGLDFDVVDVDSPQRKDLLVLSLLQRQFPQFFLQESNGTVSFFGTYDSLEELPAAVKAPPEPGHEDLQHTDKQADELPKEPLETGTVERGQIQPQETQEEPQYRVESYKRESNLST
jgi:glutaredoxin